MYFLELKCNVKINLNCIISLVVINYNLISYVYPAYIIYLIPDLTNII